MNYQQKPSYRLTKHNLELARGLLKNKKFFDWIVTALYYSALMLAQTLYETRSWPIPKTHRTNGDKIGWNQSIGDLVGKKAKFNFDTLCRASQKYRYDPNEALSLNYNVIRQYVKFYNDFTTEIQKKLSE
ncbi:MAG: hypothetical protein AAB880_01485 [Patescibacteria group bacterium]